MRTRFECNCCHKELNVDEWQNTYILDGMCFDCSEVVAQAKLDLPELDEDDHASY